MSESLMDKKISGKEKQGEMQSETTEAYRREIEKWRQERDESYRSPDGWLSLTGLFILEDGEYSLGSGEDQHIVLPPSAPAHLGTLHYKDGIAVLRVNRDLSSDVPVLVNGTAVTEVELLDNRSGQRPTIVKVGSVSMNLHRFSNQHALRVRDSSMPAIQDFSGCKWYEIKPEYCVRGQLTRLNSPAAIEVTTSVETVDEYRNVGAIEFELLGRRLQLLASPASKANELFIIFRDATSGHETYGAGRYLYCDVDAEGNVTLDFNKAYSPPCAFTPFATCALPPAQNRLPIAVEAGELS